MIEMVMENRFKAKATGSWEIWVKRTKMEKKPSLGERHFLGLKAHEICEGS